MCRRTGRQQTWRGMERGMDGKTWLGFDCIPSYQAAPAAWLASRRKMAAYPSPLCGVLWIRVTLESPWICTEPANQVCYFRNVRLCPPKPVPPTGCSGPSTTHQTDWMAALWNKSHSLLLHFLPSLCPSLVVLLMTIGSVWRVAVPHYPQCQHAADIVSSLCALLRDQDVFPLIRYQWAACCCQGYFHDLLSVSFHRYFCLRVTHENSLHF